MPKKKEKKTNKAKKYEDSTPNLLSIGELDLIFKIEFKKDDLIKSESSSEESSQTEYYKLEDINEIKDLSFLEGNDVSDKDLKEALKHFENFYEEIFLELSNFGELKELNVLDNLSEHLIGNVYAKFNDEDSASKAFKALEGTYYHSEMV